MTEPRVRLTSGLLRRAAIVSAQFLLVVVALWALTAIVKHLSYVVIPVLVALLLTALLEPIVSWLVRHRWPRSLAVLAALIVGLVVVGGIVTFMVLSIVDAYDELRLRVLESVAQLQNWLNESPFQASGGLLDRVQQWLSGNQQAVISQAVGAFSTISAFVVGLVVAIVLFVMFLYDAPKLWSFMLLPWRPRTREIVDDAGRRAYRGVVLYVRVTALVAFIDALGIGIGLAIVGVPLTVPLAALVFLGGFVPYVGAVASGVLAVVVTLVSNGFVAALIITGVVLGVQQLEGQVLQPVLQGNFSRLHPAVVLVALIIGGAEGGIAGILFAVPVLAAAKGAVLAIAEHRQEPDAGEAGTGETAQQE
ncbi:putative PurR-regulated permease PerM [Saccharomonospora amisosensis]|uniref:Putative PurR-regulated permease PerM n=1 Tax=Saccharomonospora amisosensis TaxID=1128677 RepID=A0A7X5UU61_9PSEU|nr:AI-2E family transporter [Saccharomonospora amisosensis]NIJ13769.1 putative PurR-regulated permease PerM [Saccharomonospora amisosensis]